MSSQQNMRNHSPLDKLLMSADNALKTLFGGYQAKQKSPAEEIQSDEMSAQQSKHAAGLMRVNHCGEVCAQALYQGQALTAKLADVRDKMQQAAAEENDHLAWCSQRLQQLDSHSSLLNPFWYASSFTLGALAGLAGDKWSLGFVAETENQVVRHLDDHLQKLPAEDLPSRAIIQRMREDELKHATHAIESGAAELPAAVTSMMRLMSKVMTSTVYYI